MYKSYTRLFFSLLAIFAMAGGMYLIQVILCDWIGFPDYIGWIGLIISLCAFATVVVKLCDNISGY